MQCIEYSVCNCNVSHVWVPQLERLADLWVRAGRLFSSLRSPYHHGGTHWLAAVVFLRCPWRRRSRHAASPSPPAASLLARPPAPRASPRISSSVASLAAGSAAPRHR